MSDLRQHILASLQPDDVNALSHAVLSRLAERLAPYLADVVAAPEPNGWLDFDGALQYLGMTKGTLYKLTSARTIPFQQDGPGCKLWFLRPELEEWRQNSGRAGPVRTT